MSSTLAPFYAVWLSCAGVLAIALMVWAWQRRSAPGALGVMAFLAMVSVWTLTYAAHWASRDPNAQHIWLALTFVAALFSPVCVWFLVRSFIEPARPTAWWQWILLLFVALSSTLILLLDDPWGLMFGPRNTWTGHSLLHGGLWFRFGIFYGYALIALSLARLVRVGRESVGLYRTQVALLLLGILVPVLALAAELIWGAPFPELDLTPFVFLITGGVFLYGVLGVKLLDLVPVARHLLIEQLPDGVLLLDEQRRVIDLNHTAREMVGPGITAPLGLPAEQVFAHMQVALQKLWPLGDMQTQLSTEDGRRFDVRVSQVTDPQRVVRGHLVTWRDITEQHRAGVELRSAHRELQARFREIEALQAQVREQSLRDPLTGLHNRRYLQEQLATLAGSGAGETGYSVILFDIDHFKSINDQHGHGGGDEFLCGVAALMRRMFDQQALTCRYGGEEFLVLLPATSQPQGRAVAENIRREMSSLTVTYEGQSIRATASVGVAHFPEDGSTPEALLLAADHALYQAKASGRDQVYAARMALQ